MNQAMSVLTSQSTVEWYTPAWLIELARETMGGIDLDPASSAQAQRTVKAGAFYTVAEDGYKKPFFGRVWLNPPFDDTPRWERRLSAAYQDGDIDQAILLVNSAPGYNWWEALYRSRPVCLLRERVRFVNATGIAAGQAKKGTTIAYFGPYVSKFDSVWSDHGRVLLP
jgi:hypothetical protein